MNVDEYVAARYGRLLEHAVALGAEEGLAAEYVDQVLLDQRRAIRRSEDPDPVVHEALERAVLKLPEPGRSPWPYVGIVMTLVAIGVGMVLARDTPTEPMPSLFGYTGDTARSVLEEDGYDVLVRPVRACEPLDQVLSSDPHAGEPVERGARVSVFTAAPSGSECGAGFARRREAWEFLDFAITGASTPRFARTVTVVIDGVEGEPRSGVGAAGSQRWTGIRRLIATQAQRPAQSPTGQPELVVTEGRPPPTTCGIPRPPGAADRSALRLVVDSRPLGASTGCPLVVDLYADSAGVMDGVVVYSAADPS